MASEQRYRIETFGRDGKRKKLAASDSLVAAKAIATMQSKLGLGVDLIDVQTGEVPITATPPDWPQDDPQVDATEAQVDSRPVEAGVVAPEEVARVLGPPCECGHPRAFHVWLRAEKRRGWCLHTECSCVSFTQPRVAA